MTHGGLWKLVIMFSKLRNKAKLPTIISEDSQFTGDIISSGEVQIDGQVIGDVHAFRLQIHKNASVKGNVTAEYVELCGNITGNVQTSDIHMMSGSSIEGDVTHRHIRIEAGATINGACQSQIHQDKPAQDGDNVFTTKSKTFA